MDLAALTHRGEVTPLELTHAAIERIEALNPRLNAVVEREQPWAERLSELRRGFLTR